MELLANNRDLVPVAGAAGITITHDFVWDVVKAKNNDTVLLGYLPAFHQLDLAGCCLIADAAAPAMNVDVYVGDPANVLASSVAVTGSAFSRSEITGHEKAFGLGVAQVNRPIYLKLNTAPTKNGGTVRARLTYFAANSN